MSKQVQDAYIVAATRTPVGKAPRGVFRNTRPDDMLAHVIRAVLEQAPGIDPALIADAIIGCAMPEAEQGMNVARTGVLLAGLPEQVPGVTINRFCSSGVQAIAMAADRIRLGEADLMLAGGTESMSMVPMMGHKVAMNPAISCAISLSGGRLRWSISADARIVPSGFRSSCASPAVNCPSAASRSERRTSASAICRCWFAVSRSRAAARYRSRASRVSCALLQVRNATTGRNNTRSPSSPTASSGTS